MSIVHEPPQSSTWNGYVLAGDNLDRNVKPRHQTIKCRTQSLHWFNSMAVKDRCDFSALPDAVVPCDVHTCDVLTLLPDANDCEQLIDNVAVMIGRILIKYVPSFSKFSELAQSHISHKYSSQMSLKSHVVSYMHIL